MKRNTLVTILIIIAAVIVGIVLLTSGNTTQTQQPNATTTQESQIDDEEARRITAKHQYNSEEGIHIVAGEIDLPTPCHLLEHEVTTADEGEVTINFTVSREDADQMCAQVITPQRFKVTFEASEGVEIGATYNGDPAILNLVPVDEDENLEEYEVYQKG